MFRAGKVYLGSKLILLVVLDYNFSIKTSSQGTRWVFPNVEIICSGGGRSRGERERDREALLCTGSLPNQSVPMELANSYWVTNRLLFKPLIQYWGRTIYQLPLRPFVSPLSSRLYRLSLFLKLHLLDVCQHFLTRNRVVRVRSCLCWVTRGAIPKKTYSTVARDYT